MEAGSLVLGLPSLGCNGTLAMMADEEIQQLGASSLHIRLANKPQGN